MGLLRLQGEGFLNADPLAAATWFRRAAVQGDAPSQLHLARALASGRGTTTNSEEALHWAEASAQQGAPDAMLLAGDLWQARDSAKAKAWHVQAMNGLQPALHQREPQACLTYGQMRQAGKGLPADPVEGLAWMKVAEARGLPGLQTITIRMTEGQLTPAQREAADLRARALLSPP